MINGLIFQESSGVISRIVGLQASAARNCLLDLLRKMSLSLRNRNGLLGAKSLEPPQVGERQRTRSDE